MRTSTRVVVMLWLAALSAIALFPPWEYVVEDSRRTVPAPFAAVWSPPFLNQRIAAELQQARALLPPPPPIDPVTEAHRLAALERIIGHSIGAPQPVSKTANRIGEQASPRIATARLSLLLIACTSIFGIAAGLTAWAPRAPTR